jgi:chemotaxis protein MotA
MRGELLSAGGLLLGVGVIAAAQVAGGGDLRTLAQPVALFVVFGGTAAALVVSFPWRSLRHAVLAAFRVFRHPPAPPDVLVPTFLRFAQKARRDGLMALESEIDVTSDGFLARALSVTVSGLPPDLVRQTLEIDSRSSADRDEEMAEVFDAAAGYAPTLGIVGAVIGLMGVMGHLSSAGGVGSGIAAAFVATIYGVGAANLIFLPLATRLRVRARVEALRRELMIDGILALHDRLHPSLLEDRLTGFLRPSTALGPGRAPEQKQATAA